MIRTLRNTLSLLLVFSAVAASAQFARLHVGSVSVGGTGQFTTPLTSNPSSGVYNVPFQNGATTYATTISGQRQFTTTSVGFLTSVQLHPAAWAGIELNYGFNHYSERFAFNYATPNPTQTLNVPTDMHEFTAAYSFHPKHIPFQPFVNIGGGYLDFTPRNASNQFRETGLAEVGFDLPGGNKHIGWRVQGRSLFYRAPNFSTSSISTRSWRVTEEPSVSVFYKF
jgi:hypothetical protein